MDGRRADRGPRPVVPRPGGGRREYPAQWHGDRPGTAPGVGPAGSLQLPVPPDLAHQIARQGYPLLVMLYYDLRSFTDPAVPTVATALTNAFFTIFGTNEGGPPPVDPGP